MTKLNVTAEIAPELADYCENRRAWSIERKHGWIGRYSAPGRGGVKAFAIAARGGAICFH